MAESAALKGDRPIKNNLAAGAGFLARLGRTHLAMTIIGAATIWSLLASFLVWRWEEAQIEDEIAEAAYGHFLALQIGVDEYLNKLVALRAYFESSADVTRYEFETFAGRLLEQESAIQNFSWVPRVRHADRAAFEASTVRDGISNYGIKAVTPDDKIVTSPAEDEYLPIFYSTVKDRQSPIYGLDLLSQPVIRQRLERARDNDQLSVVPDFILHSVEGNVHGFLFSLPVYRQGMPADTEEERQHNLLGFVHGAFLTAQAIEHVLANRTAVSGLDIYLFAPNAAPNAPPLHVHSSRLRSSPAEARPQTALAAGLHFEGVLKAGDARWKLVAVPAPGAPHPTHDRTWLVLGSSLLLVFLGTLHLRSTGRYTRKLLLANKEISDLAQRDSLTGLPNRRAFNERLAAAFAASRRNGRPFAVLYFDLDHFKDTNDTLGHPAGDILLQEVAARVRSIVRPDDVFARFGGDEFAILQSDGDASSAARLAARLNKALAVSYSIKGNIVQLSASIGIARCTTDSVSPDSIMIQADLALYRAKADGRNCFRFHSQGLDYEVHERVVLAEDMRKALEGDQMRLYYQPQVDLVSGRIIGVEALLRWQHPKRGLLDPALFVPVAERTGIITVLGDWVFNEACRQTREWIDQAIAPTVVAVNVSANQFKVKTDFEEFLSMTLQKWRVPPSAMEIELTESVLMEVSLEHNDTLERVRRIGMRIAIDDFGTGYSSLSYLASYPVSRLKIAQELVLGVIGDLRHATVVRAAIRLANEMQIECLAEGIETAAQVNFLKAAGCSFGQGYYFSEPLSAARMTALLKECSARSKGAIRRLERIAG